MSQTKNEVFMSFPNSRIIISKDGSSRIESDEKSDLCHKLSELGKAAGKVTSDQEKDHTPVYQTVSMKGA
jgi:hypothetical protein